jgi:MFS family permease
MPNAQVTPPSGGLWSAERRPLTLGLVLTITLVAAEALAVTTAMPIVARELGGLELYGLVFSSFIASSLVGIVIAGLLIDRRGVVAPFAIGLVLFAIGLTIAGAAVSMPMLILGRLVQGLGGGAIPPIAYVAIGRSLPEYLRPRMFATLSTAWILPGVFGPGIAGVVAELFSWRLIFFGLLPVLLVSGAMAYRGLSTLRQPATATATGSTASRVRNGVLVGLGVIAATTGLQAESPALILGLGLPGLALAGWAFLRLAPPGTLRAARGYPTAVLLRGVLTFAFFCVDAYVALMLVEVRGWTAAEAGIALTAATLSWTAGSWVQARLSSRFAHERFVMVGFPVVAAGLAGLGLILVPAIPAWLSVPIFAVAGFGMGITYSQFALIVLRDVPHDAQGEVTAGLTLSDSLGTALGLTVSGALVATGVRAGEGPVPGLAAAIAVGATVALMGWLLAPRLRPAASVARGLAAEAAARLR